jgi:hypothetical protein
MWRSQLLQWAAWDMFPGHSLLAELPLCHQRTKLLHSLWEPVLLMLPLQA